MTIGENIKKARKNAGLTQKELGNKLGMTAAAVSAFEKNKTNIKYSTLEKFGEVLNIDAFYLLDENFDRFEKNIERSIDEHDSILDILEKCFKVLLYDRGFEISFLYHEYDNTEDLLQVDKVSILVDNNKVYEVDASKYSEFAEEIFEYFKMRLNKYIDNGFVQEKE